MSVDKIKEKLLEFSGGDLSGWSVRKHNSKASYHTSHLPDFIYCYQLPSKIGVKFGKHLEGILSSAGQFGQSWETSQIENGDQYCGVDLCWSERWKIWRTFDGNYQYRSDVRIDFIPGYTLVIPALYRNGEVEIASSHDVVETEQLLALCPELTDFQQRA